MLLIVDIDKDSYHYQSARNEAFSRWLSYAATHQVAKETSKQSMHVSLLFSVCESLLAILMDLEE